MSQCRPDSKLSRFASERRSIYASCFHGESTYSSEINLNTQSYYHHEVNIGTKQGSNIQGLGVHHIGLDQEDQRLFNSKATK